MSEQKPAMMEDRLSTSLQAMEIQMQAQTESISSLAQSIKTLSCAILDLKSTITPKRASRDPQPCRWWYRAWDKTSIGQPDKEGNIIAGNPQWSLESVDDIALHFAEFHSDNMNMKRTALISASSDGILVIRRAFLQLWLYKDFKDQNPDKVFICGVLSDEYFEGMKLIAKATTDPLKRQLSKEACKRLIDPNSHIHTSEAVFLHRIEASKIRFQVSLGDLLRRGLRDRILPELEEKAFGEFIGPKRIRETIEFGCGLSSKSMAERIKSISERFKTIYSMLTQESKDTAQEGKDTTKSLELARLMMNDDALLSSSVREDGSQLFQKALQDLQPPPTIHRLRRRALVQNQKE